MAAQLNNISMDALRASFDTGIPPCISSAIEKEYNVATVAPYLEYKIAFQNETTTVLRFTIKGVKGYKGLKYINVSLYPNSIKIAQISYNHNKKKSIAKHAFLISFHKGLRAYELKTFGSNDGKYAPCIKTFHTAYDKMVAFSFSGASYYAPTSNRGFNREYYENIKEVFDGEIRAILRRYLDRFNIDYEDECLEKMRLDCIRYPLLWEFSNKGECEVKQYIPIIKLLEKNDMNRFSRLVTGSNGKKLKNIVFQSFNAGQGNKSLALASWLYHLKSLFALDDLQKIGEAYLICSKKNGLPEGRVSLLLTAKTDQLKGLKELLKNYSKSYRLRLILDLLSSDAAEYGYTHTKVRYLTDTVNMHMIYKGSNGYILPEKPKTIKELHDFLATFTRRLMKPDFELKHFKEAYKVNGLIINGYTIVLPKTYHELIEWGNKMHNCIASYAQRCGKETQILGLLNKTGELVANIEIRKKTVQQFYGDHNSPFKDMEVKLAVLKEIFNKTTLISIEPTKQRIEDADNCPF